MASITSELHPITLPSMVWQRAVQTVKESLKKLSGGCLETNRLISPGSCSSIDLHPTPPLANRQLDCYWAEDHVHTRIFFTLTWLPVWSKSKRDRNKGMINIQQHISIFQTRLYLCTTLAKEILGLLGKLWMPQSTFLQYQTIWWQDCATSCWSYPSSLSWLTWTEFWQWFKWYCSDHSSRYYSPCW